MKIPVRPLLLMFGTLIFAYMSYFLPGTIIYYQVVVHANQSTTSISQAIKGEGLIGFSDKDGINAIPCRYPSRWEPLPNSLETGFQVWQFTGKALSYVILMLGVMPFGRYVIQRKPSLIKFLVSIP